MKTEKKLQENTKIAIDYAKLTEHMHHVIAQPITTEIIKITKSRSIQTFPVNKSNVPVYKDIFRNDIRIPRNKKARDKQFPKIEVQANCNGSRGTKDLQCNSTKIAVITSQPNVWVNCIEEWMQSLNEESLIDCIGILQETSGFYLSVCSLKRDLTKDQVIGERINPEEESWVVCETAENPNTQEPWKLQTKLPEMMVEHFFKQYL